MASRSFCDRCGQEIQAMLFKVKAGVKEYDLCEKCKEAFELFLKANSIERHV